MEESSRVAVTECTSGASRVAPLLCGPRRAFSHHSTLPLSMGAGCVPVGVFLF